MDNDNPTSEEIQRYEERQMFDLFLEYVGLPVVASTIECRAPPEPDLRCQLRNGETVAFELGELSDQNARRAESTMMQFRSSLHRIFNELAPETRNVLERLYRMCRIDVAFDPDISLRRHATAIAALYPWLAKQGRFIGEMGREVLPHDIESAIPNVRISEPAPRLWIEPAFRMRVFEPDLTVFEKKLNSRYASNDPIELLLHATGRLSDRWVRHHSESLIKGMAGGPFRRVWVFSPTERASDTVHPLRFVYPARG